MISIGNGRPAICAKNLMSIIRGEIPLDRLRGLPAELIDKPSGAAMPLLRTEIEDTIRVYEPRINISDVSVFNYSMDGLFKFEVDIRER